MVGDPFLLGCTPQELMMYEGADRQNVSATCKALLRFLIYVRDYVCACEHCQLVNLPICMQCCLRCRAWQSLQDCSTCQAVVVLHNSSCLMHKGFARPGHKPEEALLGPICRRAMASEQGNYLANLALYPGTCSSADVLPKQHKH